MIVVYPSYYKKFSCIAGSCPDTCCAKWDIVVDDCSRGRYEKINSDFGERLRASMRVDSDGDTVFLNRENRCAFLNKDNLCDIYSELGEDFLCATCKKFPRFSTSFGGTEELGLSLSCPVACELIMETPFELCSEFNDNPPDLNELDADLYFYAKKLRKSIFEFVESDFDLSRFFAFSRKLKSEPFPEPDFSEREQHFSSDETFSKREKTSSQNKVFSQIEQPIIQKEIFSEFEYLTENGREVFQRYNSDIELKVSPQLKNIFTYFIYRYLLRGVYEKDLGFPIAFAVFATEVIYKVSVGERIPLGEAAVLFSKEIEHCSKNLLTFNSYRV